MAEVFAVLQNIQQVYEIIHWAVDVYKGIKGAPQAVLELTGEVECLVTCLNAFNYEDCRLALLDASDDQQRDFSTILEGCKLNVVEIKTFVSECQLIMNATDSAYKKKQKKKGLPTQFVNKVKNIWHRYKFSQADKQPMRDKLALPLHSLNVFLVSLTFSRMSVGSGVSTTAPVAPKNWAVTGRMISFKEAKFTSGELINPGTEERILEAAHHIVFGHRCIGHCCPCCTCDVDSCHCDADDHGGLALPSGVLLSPGPGRKTSSTKGRLVSDKMYLVRPKSKQRGRSKSVVRRVKREVFSTGDGTMGGRRTNDDDFDESMTSDLLDSDDSPPRRPPDFLTLPSGGPPHSPRMPSPHRDFGRSSHEYHDRGRRHHRPSSPATDFGDAEHHPRRHTRHPHISEADIQRARYEARQTAANEIRDVRNQARRELNLGMDVTERESFVRHSARFEAVPEPTDVRRYMEIRYGIVIERASSEERRVAEEAEGFQEIGEELRKMSERRSRMEFESRHHEPRRERARETVFEEFDLHISEDSGDEVEPMADLEPEIIHMYERHSIPHRRERTHTRERFVIPETEYEPVTTRLSERRSETAQRREESRRYDDTHRDLERRARELHEREEALRARERELEERLNRLNGQERTRERAREQELRPHIPVEETGPQVLVRPRRPAGRVLRRHTEVPHDEYTESRRYAEAPQEESENETGRLRQRTVPEESRTRQRETRVRPPSQAVVEVVDDETDRRRRRRVSQDPRTMESEEVVEIAPEIRVVREAHELDSTDSEDVELRPNREQRRRPAPEDPGARSRREMRRRDSSDSPPRILIR